MAFACLCHVEQGDEAVVPIFAKRLGQHGLARFGAVLETCFEDVSTVGSEYIECSDDFM